MSMAQDYLERADCGPGDGDDGLPTEANDETPAREDSNTIYHIVEEEVAESLAHGEFCINSEETANWYLGKLANLDAEKRRVKANAAAIVARIERDAARLTGRFGGEMERFVAAELARRGGRRKALALLQGTAKFTTVPARLVVADEKAALAAALRLSPDAFTKISLDRPTLLDYVKKTGEIVDGVGRTPERESFSVTFEGGK